MGESPNIESSTMLVSPGTLGAELPLPPDGRRSVARSRQELINILNGNDDRLAVIAGPCSIHNAEAALRYAGKLKDLSCRVRDRILILMRVYFEKPRTSLGWKGLIYDPNLNGEYDIEKGIVVARKLLLQITRLGLPVATELLEPATSPYLTDFVTWAGIGARTTESPSHRQLASGLPMAVGFKNGTDGNINIAIDALTTANAPHSYIGVLNNGHTGIFRTRGNPYCHLVLRGGIKKSNFDEQSVAQAKKRLVEADARPNILIDCSHGNSARDCRLQRIAFIEALRQRIHGEKAIFGMMLESFLKPGKQILRENQIPDPELSVTDSCISFEETEELILRAYRETGGTN